MFYNQCCHLLSFWLVVKNILSEFLQRFDLVTDDELIFTCELIQLWNFNSIPRLGTVSHFFKHFLQFHLFLRACQCNFQIICRDFTKYQETRPVRCDQGCDWLRDPVNQGNQWMPNGEKYSELRSLRLWMSVLSWEFMLRAGQAGRVSGMRAAG